jgi:hypothetical protein
MYVLGAVERGRRAAAVRGRRWVGAQAKAPGGKVWTRTHNSLYTINLSRPGLFFRVLVKVGCGWACSFGRSLNESMKRTMQSSMGNGVLRYTDCVIIYLDPGQPAKHKRRTKNLKHC